MDWRKHITVDPRICHGTPCVTGTRVMVWVVLGMLADGQTAETVVEHHPTLTLDDIKACVHYAAALAHEQIVDIEPAAA